MLLLFPSVIPDYIRIPAPAVSNGDVFRKWTNAGTAVYDSLSFPSYSYVPSRFYVRR